MQLRGLLNVGPAAQVYQQIMSTSSDTARSLHQLTLSDSVEACRHESL